MLVRSLQRELNRHLLQMAGENAVDAQWDGIAAAAGVASAAGAEGVCAEHFVHYSMRPYVRQEALLKLFSRRANGERTPHDEAKETVRVAMNRWPPLESIADSRADLLHENATLELVELAIENP